MRFDTDFLRLWLSLRIFIKFHVRYSEKHENFRFIVAGKKREQRTFFVKNGFGDFYFFTIMVGTSPQNAGMKKKSYFRAFQRTYIFFKFKIIEKY